MKTSYFFNYINTIHSKRMVSIRKAPIEKAGIYDEGFTMTGNDNLEYIVTTTKNGFKRWTKVKSERTYKKKQCCEQGTQTDEEEIISTPTKPKKERKIPDTPNKKKK